MLQQQRHVARGSATQGRLGSEGALKGLGVGARVVERQQRRASVQGHQRHVAQALRHSVVAHVDEVAQNDVRLERLRATRPADACAHAAALCLTRWASAHTLCSWCA